MGTPVKNARGCLTLMCSLAVTRLRKENALAIDFSGGVFGSLIFLDTGYSSWEDFTIGQHEMVVIG